MMLVPDSFVRRLFCLYTPFFILVGGLESVSHRVGLDIQLYHADWKIAEDDDMEGMHVSPSFSAQADGQFRSLD